jgi:hypothetical protein
MNKNLILSIIGGVIIIISSLLPWISITISALGPNQTTTVIGILIDGQYTIIIGFIISIIALIGLLIKGKSNIVKWLLPIFTKIFPEGNPGIEYGSYLIVISIITGLIVILPRNITLTITSTGIHLNYGLGVYTTLLGTIISLISGIIALYTGTREYIKK